MIRFAFRTLRHRKAGFAGSFVALLCAAMLVCANGMLLETGLRGGAAPERYAGTPVIVAGDQFVRQTIRKSADKTKTKAKPLAEHAWLPASLAAQLGEVAGVAKVISEVTFPVYLEKGSASGHGWESAGLTPFTLREGRAPATDDEVVVDARSGLAVGARLDAVTAAGMRTYRVTGVTAQSLPSQSTLFFSTAEARRLAGRPGQVSAIGVFPRGEVSAVMPNAAAVLETARAFAHTGDDRGAVEFPDAEQARVRLISLGGALGGTSLLVAVLVVVGTFALSIQQREREIALLRAVAATPRQVRRMLGGEALLVAAAAGAAGSVAGVGLGFWLRDRFVALGAMPEHLRLVVGPFPALAALLATVLAAWAAVRLSARRAARIRPVEALGEAALSGSRTPWGRTVAGLVCVGGGVALTIVLSALSVEAASSPVTMLTALVWTTAVALLGPVVARAATALLGTPLRASRAGGHLAAANLRTGSRRLASVIAPLSLMVAMTCTILFVQTTMGHAAQREAAAGGRADYVLGPHLPGTAARTLRETPGVEAVTEVLRTSVRVGLDKYGAQAVTPEGLDRTVDLGVTAGSLRDLGKDGVAVSETAAARIGAEVGGRVRLTLGDGTPAVLTVVAIYARGLGYGDLTLSHALVAPHVDDPLGTLLVSAPTLTRAAITAVVPGAAVLDRAEAVDASAPNAAVNYVAMGLIIAFTAIAVVNTLAMSTSDRSRELALLRLVGTTRRQVLRMLRLETLTALVVAVALGTGISLVTLSAFSSGMTGSAVPYVPPLAYLAVVAVAAVLALAATAIPARFVLRQRPADVIGVRQ
ncbi:FtsX-like permease family protein [Planotetraspora kaengkrachanensis]|uniref:ABC transporter permease n=1 Tax=Planotetraspora kaengkrachanensis TaxID=575193 RepID=A0A8J3PXU7_9ACTN|nr:FtsX-like permease family protein [Planotetraspora kaengkrachanensis]GIG83132.1 ABC transporter permease [Planotetraspora kaengkrachanensis]